jgi:hypothetical protein
MRMAMAFLMKADFPPEFPPRSGTLICALRGRLSRDYVGHAPPGGAGRTQTPKAELPRVYPFGQVGGAAARVSGATGSQENPSSEGTVRGNQGHSTAPEWPLYLQRRHEAAGSGTE